MHMINKITYENLFKVARKFYFKELYFWIMEKELTLEFKNEDNIYL